MTTKQCTLCYNNQRFRRSQACFSCLRRARLVVDAETGVPIGMTDDGRASKRVLAPARYRYRAVRCGKPQCKRCGPGGGHELYCYRVWMRGQSPAETYVGKVLDPGGTPYDPPGRTGRQHSDGYAPEDYEEDDLDDLDDLDDADDLPPSKSHKPAARSRSNIVGRGLR